MNEKKSKFLVYLFPGLRDILFISILIAVMLLGARMLNMDGDLPRHLLTGKFILETKTIPTTEPFAYPYQGKPYVSHEWLTDIIFYLIYKFIGLTGIVILSALLLATTFYTLYAYTSFRFNLHFTTLFLVLWGAAATSLNWITRPHLISMLFLVLWLIWLDKLRRGEKIGLWRFPLLMLFWSNMHGEFIAGFLAMTACIAGWIWDYLFAEESAQKDTGLKLLLATVLSFLASLINPAGLGPWKTLLGFVNNSYLMSRMYEANPPDFSQPEFMVLLGLLAFSIFLLAINKQKVPTSWAFLLAGFSAMSLIAGRNIHLYGIVAAFVLPEAVNMPKKSGLLTHLENSISGIEKNLKGIFWPVMTTLACFLLVTREPVRNIYNFDAQMFPLQATDWIATHPQSGRLFNDLNWGGYLALHLWPDQLVFVDSMADTTGELTMEYENVITLSPTWKEILTNYQVEWTVIQTSSLLATELKKEGWTTLYKDKTAIILRSNTAP
jgi:hypothetical protein